MNDLEDLLVRTLRDPARALPAPAEPMAGIRSRARAQRRNAVLVGAAVVLATVAALVVPMSLRTTGPLPPAAPAPPAPNQSLLDWAPRGPLARDTALVAAAERTWREDSLRPPAGAVSLLWAGRIRGGPTVLLQGRDRDGAALVALTAGDPQRVVRVDPLTDPGTAGVRLAVDNAAFLLMRPDTASVYVLEEWGSTGWAKPVDGVVPDAVGYKVRQYVVRDASGQILGEGTVAPDSSLPLVAGPVRQAAPTWRHARLVPLPIAGEIGRQVVPRLDEAGAAGPVEVAALEGGFGGKPAELYAEGTGARSFLYEVRRSGRTWLASGVRSLRPDQAPNPVQCLRLTEITGRVAATDALVTRCWLPENRVGVVLVHLADGVRLTGATLAAARPGERTWRYSGKPVGSGLAQGFGTDFPTGPGQVTLVDAAGKPLPPVEVPPYS